ncbi:transcription elongation factor B polypeptide 3-like [Ornithodoros turicata]|uniref:Putative transcription elongation factor b polypeptide n=1 Tax=Ornithodoros turicata TaxID=34597 RepID=A0A2R5LDY6_9ACAR
MADWKEKVLHYGKRLERNQSDDKVLETLHKLQKIPMTLSVLQETNIGRIVSQLKKQDGPVGEKARAVVRAWKEVVTSKSQDTSERSSTSKRKKEIDDDDDDPPPVKSHRSSKQYSIEVESSHQNGNVQHSGVMHAPHHHHHHHHHHQNKVEEKPAEKASRVDKKEMKKLLKKAGHSEGGLDGSVASFEACLGLNDSVQQPKIKKKMATTPVKKPVTKTVAEVQQSSSSPTKKESSHHQSSSKSKRSTSKEENHHARKMPEALQKPNLAPLDREEVLSTLPEIQPVYKPLPHHRFMEDGPVKNKRNLSNEEAIIFTSSRKDRTAVYSGRKSCYLPEVPTLYEACVRVLTENVEGLAYTGGVPYDILKPVLERCTPTQLYSLEDYNPYLLDDSDELWQVHCGKDFKGIQPDAGETWREMYLKKYDEREEKLKSLTATISASMSKATPVRQTKLAYVDSVAKPPRNVARQQAKHGTGLPISQPLIKPTERAALARSGCSGSSSGSSRIPNVPSGPPKKPKIAPLMQKTLKFMKQRFKR